MVAIRVSLLAIAASACAHGVHRERSPAELVANEQAVERLRARHPGVQARVLGSDSDFGVIEKRQAASRTGGPTGATVLTGAAASYTSIANIGISTSAEPNLPAVATPTAGTASPIKGAPALPAVNIVPANWPTLDKAPPTDSSFVQGLLAKLDLSKVPNIAVNNPGACANASNAAAVAAANTNCWWTCGNLCTRATDITVCPNKNTWGLSYDDGPSPDTPRLLNFLDAQSPALKTTFFIVGSRAISRPAMLQYELMDGHQLCVHTWSHTALTTQTNEQIVAELGWCREAIRQITGVSPNCMRPPYGDIDDRVRYISLAMGMTPIIWTAVNGRNFDSQDWQIGGAVVTAPQVANNFETILGTANSLSTGFIVLEHDLYQQAVSLAIEFVLPYALSTKQFTIEPIIQCLGKQPEDGYVETATNATISGGSTASGTLSVQPSVTNAGLAVSTGVNSGNSGSNASPSKGAAAAASIPSLFTLVAAPAIALVALAARLA